MMKIRPYVNKVIKVAYEHVKSTLSKAPNNYLRLLQLHREVKFKLIFLNVYGDNIKV